MPLKPSAGDLAEIPEDLLIEILLRVPAKLVTKFRRLSKFHRDWIDSPDFIRKHCNLSMRRTSCSHIIVVPNSGTWIWGDYQVVRLDSTEFGARVEKSINSFKEKGYSLVDSCVGIVCLLLPPKAGRDGHILVWNPLTGGRRTIDVQYDINFKSLYFLGHDAVTDDLKILSIGNKNSKLKPQCQIYSCRNGSWRKISDDNYEPVSLLNFWRHRVWVEGTSSLHTIDPFKESIITFDFSLEKFNRIALPERPGDLYQCCLLDLNGRLCIGNYDMPCDACTRRCWSVWEMKEYGVKESVCVRLFCWRDLTPVLVSLQHVNGCQRLILLSGEYGEYTVGMYDGEEEKLIKFSGKESRALCWPDRPTRHFLYIPSLRQVGEEEVIWRPWWSCLGRLVEYM